MILVDTCVLSEAYRKKKTNEFGKEVESFHQMILDDWPIGIPGIVFQEFLSGLKNARKFEKARQAVEGFPIVLADQEDHQLASQIRTQCLSKGVSAHGIDCLIAATAINRNSRLLTYDKDFAISKVCHLKLMHIS